MNPAFRLFGLRIHDVATIVPCILYGVFFWSGHSLAPVRWRVLFFRVSYPPDAPTWTRKKD